MKRTIILGEKVLTASSLLGIFMVSCTLSSHVSKRVISTSNPLVTFVIPTLGRPTLERTLISLQNQHNPSWKAIVVFDGIKGTKLSSDPRIKFIQISKIGQFNHGGEVRNQGMEQVTTEWVAFVDDDDYLSPDYVDRLEEEINLKPNLDVVIFRMYHPNREAFIPSPQVRNFSEGNVGISFSMRTALYKAGFKFTPSSVEDFKLLEYIRKEGHKMVLSPYATYLIREAACKDINNGCNCIRAYIN
ncbi:MAG: hypothetical protein BGO68_05665 [Candidatus Amoebophilus sp. 36-38]|nr:MAG: hypothetical protein BGO68_05665 [Candidatus Amoebophilus sp. 36-38]